MLLLSAECSSFFFSLLFIIKVSASQKNESLEYVCIKIIIDGRLTHSSVMKACWGQVCLIATQNIHNLCFFFDEFKVLDVL